MTLPITNKDLPMVAEMIASSMVGTLLALFALYAFSFILIRSEHEFWGTVFILAMFSILYVGKFFEALPFTAYVLIGSLYLVAGIIVSFLKWHSYVRDRCAEVSALFAEILTNLNKDLPHAFADRSKLTDYKDPRFIYWYLKHNNKYSELRRLTVNDRPDEAIEDIARKDNAYEIFMDCIRPSASKHTGQISMWVAYWPLALVENALGMLGDIIGELVKYFGGVYSRIAKSAFQI